MDTIRIKKPSDQDHTHKSLYADQTLSKSLKHFTISFKFKLETS